ncbi:MAG: spore germination protein [Firmicutes bacterium]|nr:spore germination protein [Bacillota bacterium]MCL5039360.1 spore germination protein [Bacillota bacterium]
MLDRLKRALHRIYRPTQHRESPGQGGQPSNGPKTPLTGDLAQDKEWLKATLGASFDFQCRELEIGQKPSWRAALLYFDGLVDKELIDLGFLRSLLQEIPLAARPVGDRQGLLPQIKVRFLNVADVREAESYEELVDDVLAGNAALLADGCKKALILGVPGWEHRQVSEPADESVIRGPRDGFVETLRVNTALIRRRIKDPALRLEGYKIGRRTKTEVVVTYLQGIADDKIVEEVRRRLLRIDIDGILESGYLEELIEDAPYSPFAQMGNTERPDRLSACLLEGKVGILVDGSPIALKIPITFTETFQASDDYYERFWLATFLRWIRFINFLVALLLPSFYIALTTYHQELIPSPLLISIAAAREGIPFPAVLEAFLMETTLEVMREAGLRLPKPIGNAISIVGALVLGQVAVATGLVSATMVVVVGYTAIATFISPRYSFMIPIRLLRFPMMILAGTLGLFGVMVGFLAVHIHLMSLRSFGVPYMMPLAPMNWNDLKDILIRAPWWALRTRPVLNRVQELRRQRAGAGPKPEAQ